MLDNNEAMLDRGVRLYTEAMDRAAILEAIRRRRTYGATDNILLDVRAGFAKTEEHPLPPVSEGILFWPSSWSSDGSLLAGRAARAGQIEQIVVRTNATGEYASLEGTAGATNDFSLVFIDRETLVYTDDWSLWVRGLRAAESTLLYRPAGGQRVESLSATSDGRWLSWIEKADESDIWLMTLDEAADGAPDTKSDS
jgi:hypothetical protein